MAYTQINGTMTTTQTNGTITIAGNTTNPYTILDDGYNGYNSYNNYNNLNLGTTTNITFSSPEKEFLEKLIETNPRGIPKEMVETLKELDEDLYQLYKKTIRKDGIDKILSE